MKNSARLILIFPITASVASAQLRTGLLNYWPLDDNANDIAETFAGAAGTSVDHGSPVGTIEFVDAAGELGADFGTMASFDGNSYVEVNDPGPGLNDVDRSGGDLSFSLWFKASSWSATTSWQALFAHGEGNHFRIARFSNSDPVLLDYSAANPGLRTSTNFGALPSGDGQWYHVAVTTEAGVASQIFINGVLDETSSPKTIDSRSTANALHIGSNPDEAGREFNGLIDDVGMWDRALTAQEVADIYNAGVNGTPLGTLLENDPVGVSGLEITDINFDRDAGTDGEFTLVFGSEADVSYRIQYSSDLVDWTNELANPVVGAAGTVTTTTFAHPVPAASRLFFRVAQEN